MSADPLVVATGLEAVFANGDGVGPIDLTIAPGEAVLVLGPSGSGKSTLLRMLHGAIPHMVHAGTNGSVLLGGRLVADHDVAELADVVGVVAQDPETGICLPEVADEIAFPLENLQAEPSRIPAAVDAALTRVGATALRDRHTAELSGGELQRVAIAAATAAAPRLLLLDEPTAMLDGEGVAAVRDVIADVRRTTGAASVLVEHRLDEFADDDGVAGLPERWIVLDRNGRVRADGSGAGVIEQYGRELVASGCWLPLDAELHVLFGAAGGLDAESVQEAVLALAEPKPVNSEPPATLKVSSAARHPTLTARALAVTPGGAGSARRGRRGRPRRRSATRAAPAPAPVLSDIDLELRCGETVALVGANGTGKSSLLACLAGVERPAAGELTGPRAGLVFQNPEHQFMAHTVRDEVAFGVQADAGARVESMLERFDLRDFADHNPHRLSGGQKRRLSLAAVLAHDRPFLFADEPGFGLDRHATITAMRALRCAAAEGRGVLFSSHDLRAVAGYADRVLVVGDGRLLADTTPLALMRDASLLDAARLRPPRLIRWLAHRVDDDLALRGVLQGLDRLTLEVVVESRVDVAAETGADDTAGPGSVATADAAGHECAADAEEQPRHSTEREPAL